MGTRRRRAGVELAYRRLSTPYAQTLRYAEDVRQLTCGRRGQSGIAAWTRQRARGQGSLYAWPLRAGRRVEPCPSAALGLSPAAAETVAQAGLLHDLGKIGIPEAILPSAAPDHDEWGSRAPPPGHGRRSSRPSSSSTTGGHRAPSSRAPGRQRLSRRPGWPSHPVGARIVAMADVYDALTSDRPYRRALPIAEVREALAEAGATLDAALRRSSCSAPPM